MALLKMRPTLAALALAVVAASPARAQMPPASAADIEAVRQASFAYIDAIYKVDPSLVEKYVHPELAKRGFYDGQNGEWVEAKMSYEGLLNTARNWNKDGNRANDSSIREVTVHEVMSKMASVKIRAAWGYDFMQLAKYDDGWKIVNVIWQVAR